MALRTKAQFDQIFAQTLRSGQADEANNDGITASQLRSVMQDLSDSIIFRGDLVAAIDAALGGTTWQTGAGVGGGISLQAALDAIRVDDAAVNGIELERDASVPNVLTIRLILEPVHVMGRYAAIVDNGNANPADFTADVFTAAEATRSNDEQFAIPAYAGAEQFVSLGFATPYPVLELYEVHNDLAGDHRPFYNPMPGEDAVIIDIPGAGNHYVIAGVINAQTAGNEWRLVEDQP